MGFCVDHLEHSGPVIAWMPPFLLEIFLHLDMLELRRFSGEKGISNATWIGTMTVRGAQADLERTSGL
jgi:hypothetical protein